jgi:hypothetical protein
MIKVEMSSPTNLNFVYNTVGEKNFIDKYQNKLIDGFIALVTNHKINSLEELYKEATRADDEATIKRFWLITEGLSWTKDTISKFEKCINDSYECNGLNDENYFTKKLF